MLALSWTDVSEDSVHIRRSVCEATEGEGLIVKSTKTGANGHIGIGFELGARLQTLRNMRADAWEAAGSDLDQESFVFSDDPLGSAQWRPTTVSHRILRLRALSRRRFATLTPAPTARNQSPGTSPGRPQCSASRLNTPRPCHYSCRRPLSTARHQSGLHRTTRQLPAPRSQRTAEATSSTADAKLRALTTSCQTPCNADARAVPNRPNGAVLSCSRRLRRPSYHRCAGCTCK